MDLSHVERIAAAAARKGGEALMARFETPLEIREKGAADLVTNADLAAESAIVDTIRAAFPAHAILSEEMGYAGGKSSAEDTGGRWIIDPLDGTTNFAHGLPLFSVSVAFAVGGTPAAGVVFHPPGGALFSAVTGTGARLNDRPIRVSAAGAVSDSLLVTGFPYRSFGHADRLIRRFAACLKSAQSIRRLGSAALDLCYVACGRFDGFWEEGLHPWDTAAGALIVQEAGGRVTDYSNRPFSPDKKEILATNGLIHTELQHLLRIED